MLFLICFVMLFTGSEVLITNRQHYPKEATFFIFFGKWGNSGTEHPQSPSSLSLGISALFGLAWRGRGCAGYDLMSLRKRQADREAAEVSS